VRGKGVSKKQGGGWSPERTEADSDVGFGKGERDSGTSKCWIIR